jgi:hypothetical protein
LGKTMSYTGYRYYQVSIVLGNVKRD